MVDLELWRENPIFGVGPGMGMLYRVSMLKWVASHTEYSRLLAEHGVFGLMALLLLIVMAVRSIRRGNSILGKAMAASMIGWAFLFMMIDGMRLAAPAFAFGLSFATILPNVPLFTTPGRRDMRGGAYTGRPRMKRQSETSDPVRIARDRRTVFEGETGDGR
jgi:hypothetical protein